MTNPLSTMKPPGFQPYHHSWQGTIPVRYFRHWMQNLTQCRTHCFHLNQQSRIFQIILDKLRIKNLIEAWIQRMSGLGNKVWAFDSPIMKQIALFWSYVRGHIFLKIVLKMCKLRRRDSCNSSFIRDSQMFWAESIGPGWDGPWPWKGLYQTPQSCDYYGD